MQTGDDAVVTGCKIKLQAAMGKVLPATTVVEKHRRQTEPGSGSKH
jgi:hypothetical protein